MIDKTYKIVILLLIFSFSSLNGDEISDKISSFVKKSARDGVVFESIKFKNKVELDYGFYFYTMGIKIKGNSKVINDTFFTNGDYITQGLFSMNDMVNLKSYAIGNISKKLDDKYYIKDKLLFGDGNSKDRMVIFSDSVCPACVEFFKKLIIYLAKDKDRDLDVYYYGFPLERIHPTALFIDKIKCYAKLNGVEDVEFKVYNHFSKNRGDLILSQNSKNDALKIISSVLGINISSIELLNTKEIIKSVKKTIKMGEDMGINGTPSVYFNDKKVASPFGLVR